MSKETFTLNAEKRTELGKGPSRRLRTEGKVPAVVYGHGKAAVSLSIDALDLNPLIHHTGLMELQITGRKKPVTAVIKDLQFDIIKGNVDHVDFQEVRATEVVTATIPIESHGIAVGTSQGGVLDQQMHEIEIRCPANKLPELLEVDVSGLELENSILVSDLPLPEEAEAVVEPDRIVFTVALPVLEEPEPEEVEGEELEGEEAEEPEVIGKGKQEEEKEEGGQEETE